MGKTLAADREQILPQITDPVDRLLLTGRAATVAEAEEIYLDEAYAQALALLQSPMTDEELGSHPLFVLYRTRGSRAPEDSLL